MYTKALEEVGSIDKPSEVEKSQWIAIAIDQQLGPDTGRVFNDVCAEMAAGNSSAEQAAKTIEDSWALNRM
jgi:hypothetical protein